MVGLDTGDHADPDCSVGYREGNTAGGSGARAAGHHDRWPTLSGAVQVLPKPTLIYFWASWCGICRMMQTTLVDIAGDVPVITVAFQSGDRATVSGYMSKNGFEVPTIVDEEGGLGQAYGIRGVPALFFLDRAGNIRYTSIGYTTSVGIRLRLWLASQ